MGYPKQEMAPQTGNGMLKIIDTDVLIYSYKEDNGHAQRYGRALLLPYHHPTGHLDTTDVSIPLFHNASRTAKKQRLLGY